MDKRTRARRKLQLKQLDLMTVGDLAAALGWESQKVSVYVKRGHLPEPIGEVSGRLVWLGEEIKEYIEERKNASS